MTPHIVLAGAGHAHLSLITAIDSLVRDGLRVTCIGPDSFHYYSGMGPGMFGTTYTPEEIRFHVKEMVVSRGGTFIEDKVERIDPGQKQVHLASGEVVDYDVLSCNLGSVVAGPFAADPDNDVFTVKPIVHLLRARDRLQEMARSGAVRIAVLGGGGAGLEVAGNAVRCIRQAGGRPSVTLYAGRSLMPGLASKVRRAALRSMEEAGVNVLEGERVHALDGRTVRMPPGGAHGGREDGYDMVFLATGVKPSPVFAASSLPVGVDGGLLVNDALHCVDYPDIFGGGDCIAYEPRALAKVGVYAVRENPVLMHNVPAQAKGEPLKRFEPGGGYMLIFNPGDGTGILARGPLVIRHSLAFRLKDWIDRRFMRRFGNPHA